MSTQSGRLTVLGAGSWGTALAVHISRLGVPVTLWGNESAEIADMQRDRHNNHYLPGADFPKSLHVTDDLQNATHGNERLIIAVPSRVFREFIERLKSCVTADAQIAWATKGLEEQTGLPLLQAGTSP